MLMDDHPLISCTTSGWLIVFRFWHECSHQGLQCFNSLFQLRHPTEESLLFFTFLCNPMLFTPMRHQFFAVKA